MRHESSAEPSFFDLATVRQGRAAFRLADDEPRRTPDEEYGDAGESQDTVPIVPFSFAQASSVTSQTWRPSVKRFSLLPVGIPILVR